MTDDEVRRAIVWHCDPPGQGVAFQVIREGWSFENGMETREIRAIRVLGTEEADG